MERYQRQIILSQFGLDGQLKLSSARVLVVGAGGLGCPVLMLLAAAGVGTLGIVDADTVSLSNLHRQILYKTDDIDQPKVERAAYYLHQMNPDVNIQAQQIFLTTENALDIIMDYDIIVDATDNFPSRYLINDACVLLGKSLVYGAVSNFEGQVAVFNAPTSHGNRSSKYRDIFPHPPKENEIGNCAEIGVLGVLPGTIGSLQANEVIKLITGIGKPLVNQLMTLNLLTNHWQTFNIQSSSATNDLIPTSKEDFKNKDYSLECSPNLGLEIGNDEFATFINKTDVLIMDIRESHEKPDVDWFPNVKQPLSSWQETVPIFTQEKLVLFCQSGKRSLEAAIKLSEKNPNKKIYSLKGGILQWQKTFKIN